MDDTISQEENTPIPPRPVSPGVGSGIPADLREQPRWIVWAYQWVKNSKGVYRWTKVPYQPWIDPGTRHQKAKSDDPTTWGTYRQALELYRQHQAELDGIGVMLKSSGYTGLDFDKCINDGVIDPWVQGQVRKFSTYTDISPSDTGVKLLVRGTVKSEGRRNHRTEFYPDTEGRFFTITGRPYPGTPLEIAPRQELLDEFLTDEFPPEEDDEDDDQPRACSSVPDDEHVLEAIRGARNGPEVMKLFNGEWQDKYGSQSEADLALCSHLAYWCGNDPARIDRLFRSSGLMRDKWDASRPGGTYGSNTIGQAVGGPVHQWDDHREDDLIGEMFAEKATAGPTPADDKEPEFDPTKYQKKPEGRKRRGYKLGELKHLPPVRYLIKQHLTTNSFGVLYGPSGAGKSFVAIEMAMSICTGRPYLGMYPVRQGPVVYLSGEGNSGINRRFDAWCLHHKIDYPDNLLIVPYQFDLLTTAEVNEVLNIIQTDLGQAPVAVFGDTVARYFGVGDENSTKDMGAFVRGADMIRTATGATFVGVHHTGKDPLRGERGNSALRAATDTMILVDDTDGGRGSLISCTKQKEFDLFDGYIVKRRVIDLGQDDEGEEVTSCVLIPQDQGRTKYQLLPKKKKEQLVALWSAFGGNSFGPTEAAEPLGVGKSAAGEALRYLADREVLEAAHGRYTVAATVRPIIMAG